MSKYICDTCNKPKLIDPSSFKVGDEVNFTVSALGRRTASYRSKTGVITAIEGEKCSVDSKGTIHVLSLDSLTPSDAPSPLTYIFGECKCAKKRDTEASRSSHVSAASSDPAPAPYQDNSSLYQLASSDSSQSESSSRSDYSGSSSSDSGYSGDGGGFSGGGSSDSW